jgi:hypothetical protein
VAAFALLWAVVEAIAASADVGIEQVVWSRYGTHLLALVLIFGRRDGWGLVRTARPFVHGWRSLLMLGMPMSYVAGAIFVGASETWALFWIAPLVVLGGQPRTSGLARWAATICACLGTALILAPGFGVARWGVLFAVVMVACFVGYLWMTDDLSDDTTRTNLFHSALWVFIALTFRMPFVWRWPSAEGWGVLVAVGLLGLLALYALDVAIRFGGPVAFAPTLCLQPVFSLILEDGVGDLGKRAVLGTALIVLATLWVLVRDQDTPRRPASGFAAARPETAG